MHHFMNSHPFMNGQIEWVSLNGNISNNIKVLDIFKPIPYNGRTTNLYDAEILYILVYILL